MLVPLYYIPSNYTSRHVVASPFMLFASLITLYSMCTYICVVLSKHAGYSKFVLFETVPSNPNVVPQLQTSSSSSSSSSSSLVTTHVEWGNTINVYVSCSTGIIHRSATPYGKCVEWWNRINLSSQGIKNQPPPLANLLNGDHINLSSKGMKKNPSPPLTNMLNLKIAPTYLHKGSEIPTPPVANMLNLKITSTYLHKEWWQWCWLWWWWWWWWWRRRWRWWWWQCCYWW